MFRKQVVLLLLLGVLSIPAFAGDKLNVVVSILPQAYFVEQIGKDKVDVSVMIPPGGNPHTYEPTPGQLKDLSRADIYVKVGSGVEFELAWMDKLVSFNKNMLVCDSSKGIKLIAMTEHHHEDEAESRHHGEEDHHHGGKDPHVWLSPSNAIVMVSNIRDAMIKRDPQNEQFYRDNASRLVLELSDLKQEIESMLANLPTRTFMIFHPAWGYFASDFNLRQVAAEECGKDPTPRQLAGLIKQAKDLNARVIFSSPQFSQRSARVIADEIDGRVELIDPLAKDYINNLRKAAELLAGN